MNEGVKNAALFVLAMLFALAAAELLARTVYEPRTKEITTFRLSRSDFYQRDDELGWLPKKNV